MAPLVLAQNALTTLERLKAALNITTVPTLHENDNLIGLINSASGFMEEATRRVLWRDTAIVENVAGFGWFSLIMSRTPINALTSITKDGETVSLTDVKIEDPKAGLISRTGGWENTAQVARDISKGPLPGTEETLFAVTYDGGYYTRPQTDASGSLTDTDITLPWDLEDACIELVRNFPRRTGRDSSVKSERLLSWSASYVQTFAPQAVMDVLQFHRRNF